MRNCIVTAVVCALLASADVGVGAQQPANADAAGQDSTAAAIASLNDKTTLQVQVVVARYLGDKRVSSLPYVLSVNAVGSTRQLGQAESSQLRMRSEVPVMTRGPAAAASDADGQKSSPLATFTYRSIGTNIDCRARSMGDGRYELGISVEDTSVFTDVDAAPQRTVEMPVFRSFQASHTMILRDAESRQFTAATDRVTGEVVRIDVTLTVVK